MKHGTGGTAEEGRRARDGGPTLPNPAKRTLPFALRAIPMP
jgi:hypothetical protein